MRELQSEHHMKAFGLKVLKNFFLLHVVLKQEYLFKNRDVFIEDLGLQTQYIHLAQFITSDEKSILLELYRGTTCV